MKTTMWGALWSLVDESHLGEQPDQSPILELTHQLCLQPVNRAMQESVKTCQRSGGRGEAYFCVSLISDNTLLPIISNNCPIDLSGDGLMRYTATFFTSDE